MTREQEIYKQRMDDKYFDYKNMVLSEISITLAKILDKMNENTEKNS